MTPADDLMRENQALRERLSRLSEASLRINESLDPDTVLQEVMDSARTLTGARFGSITTLDDEGGLLNFITSGLSPEEREEMLALTEGPRLFEYFSSVQGPLRLRNAADHMRALGFPEGHPPVRSLMGTPMRHQGERVGNLYVAEKEGGGEFTAEDEETLVMFASQAALVIVNARRHRDERRARADLETLINTSPVGVVVFDARTGAPVSLNRETRRILGDLRTPGGSVEQLLDVLTFRAGRRTGDCPGPVPPGPGAEHRGDGAGRGNRDPGPRRPVGDHPGQRYAHPLGGGRGRVRGRHPAGPDPAGRAGAAAGRVPGHGEPRAAHPADLGQKARSPPCWTPPPR